jgi:hypothetical protein
MAFETDPQPVLLDAVRGLMDKSNIRFSVIPIVGRRGTQEKDFKNGVFEKGFEKGFAKKNFVTILQSKTAVVESRLTSEGKPGNSALGKAGPREPAARKPAARKPAARKEK